MLFTKKVSYDAFLDDKLIDVNLIKEFLNGRQRRVLKAGAFLVYDCDLFYKHFDATAKTIDEKYRTNVMQAWMSYEACIGSVKSYEVMDNDCEISFEFGLPDLGWKPKNISEEEYIKKYDVSTLRFFYPVYDADTDSLVLRLGMDKK